MRLIALAHGLEVAAHGGGHLRELPEPPQVLKKKVHDTKLVSTGALALCRLWPKPGSIALCRSVATVHVLLQSYVLHFAFQLEQPALPRPQLTRWLPPSRSAALQLPGWGVEGGEWAEIDRLNEEELAAAEAALMQGGGDAGASRIATQIQQLNLGGGEGGEAYSGDEGSQGEEEEESEDEGEWETAAKSASSGRLHKRRVSCWLGFVAAVGGLALGVPAWLRAMLLPCQAVCLPAALAQLAFCPLFLRLQAARKAAWEARQAAAAAEGEQHSEEDGSEGSEGSEDEEGEEGEGADGGDREDACSLASDDDATAAHAAPAEGEGLQQQQSGEGQQQHGAEGQQQQEGEQRFLSTVSIITADFAMQNVIMQVRPGLAGRGCLPAAASF